MFYVHQNAPGIEPACSVDNTHSGTPLGWSLPAVYIRHPVGLHWREVIFLGQQVSIADSFLVLLGILFSLIPLRLELEILCILPQSL